MRLLIPTDAFPPVCGGSGWSTYALAAGCAAAATRSRSFSRSRERRPGVRERDYDGFRIIELGAPAPNLPYVRNYFKNERLYSGSGGSARRSHRPRARRARPCAARLDVPAAIGAARRRGVPSVCTIRDYWPVCYWSDLIHTAERHRTVPGLLRRHDDAVRAAPAGAFLAAGAADDSVHARQPRPQAARARAAPTRSSPSAPRSPPISGRGRRSWRDARIEMIPNPVDIAGLRAAGEAAPPPMPGPYALYVGKLAPNKGSEHLVDIAGEGRPAVAARHRRRWAGSVDRRGRGTCILAGRPAHRLGRSIGHGGVAASRIAPGLPLARTGVAEPRAHRGQRAGRSDRRDAYRRHR